MTNLQDTVAKLAAARRLLALEKDNVASIQGEIDAQFGVRMSAATSQLNTTKGLVAALERETRNTALDEYELSGDKRPHLKVSVRIYTVVDYDEDEAKSFAIAHMQDALRLDKKTFDKNAKSLAGMDLGPVTDRLGEVVTIRDDPRAMISKDLGGY